MINCKGCPFSYTRDGGDYFCAINFEVLNIHWGDEPTSKDCKLFAVTYALKNEIGSIRFSPKEMEEELSQQEIDKKLANGLFIF